MLETGDFLGMGGKLFAILWNALEVDGDDKGLVLDATKEQFENAEGFDKNNWPDFANTAFGERAHRAFGQEPYYASRQAKLKKTEEAARMPLFLVLYGILCKFLTNSLYVGNIKESARFFIAFFKSVDAQLNRKTFYRSSSTSLRSFLPLGAGPDCLNHALSVVNRHRRRVLPLRLVL